MVTLTLLQPDDWHCHLRQGEHLTSTVSAHAQQFHRAIVMPNLTPPVLTPHDAAAYQQAILSARPAHSNFTPLMTLYLTEHLDINVLKQPSSLELIKAIKLYPKGATTHSAQGVTSLQSVYPVLSAMQELGIVLAVHGEVTDPNVDIFDREAVFIERELIPIIDMFPELKIVLEHISTQDAVDFVAGSSNNIGATITPQHLLLNRNDLLAGGLHPHHYCLPIVKAEKHRQAVLSAATSGNPQFFLGTDSAPHAKTDKESACGCAGIYSAHAAIELYAQAFDQVDALDKLENFASVFGAEFYNLPVNTQTVMLRKAPWQVPESLPFGNTPVIPLFAGKTLQWKYITHDN